jgi:FkbM family methyltransferase
MKLLPRVRDFAFRCMYGRRGFPVRIAGDEYRLDPQLRRWNVDAERDVREVFDRVIRNGDTVADIGANFGLHTMYLASLTGAAGRVFAFEPVPSNVGLLRTHLRYNGFTDCVTVVQSAVSNSPAQSLDLRLSEDAFAVEASLVGGSELRRITVPNVRLDDFEFGTVPTLLKIDVEGAELEVIRGGEALLRRSHPVLVMEVHGPALAAFGSSVPELQETLRSFGYLAERRVPGSQFTGEDYFQAIFTAE